MQSGQTAKTEITGVLQQTLRALKLSGKPVRVASADRCLADLISVGHFTQETSIGWSALLDKSSKITFPIPGTLKGHTASKPATELKGVYLAHDEQDGPKHLPGCNLQDYDAQQSGHCRGERCW